MSYRLVYSPEALIEFKDAVSWYDVRSKRAAVNFVKAVKEKTESICRNPLRYKNTLFILSILLMKVKRQLFCHLYIITKETQKGNTKNNKYTLDFSPMSVLFLSIKII